MIARLFSHFTSFWATSWRMHGSPGAKPFWGLFKSPLVKMLFWLPVFSGLLALCALFFHFQQLPLAFPSANQELVVLIDSNPLTYEAESENEPASGLEHDLVQAFAEELGVPVRFLVVPHHEIHARLTKNEAHFAAAWLSPEASDKAIRYSPPYFESRDVLVHHEAALPARNLESLKGETVFACRDSRQYQALLALQAKIPDLKVEAYPLTPLDLLGAVASREIEIALIDKTVLNIGLNFYPNLQPGLEVGEPYPIAWQFPADGNPEIYEKARVFLEKSRENGLLTRLNDRYLGHVERLGQIGSMVFIERIFSLLPKYQSFFKEAQLQTDIDWRLLAALSYQESHWDPLNTSYTGVRGMMMLTEDTADRLGVKNRLDPRESILGGARYVDFLKNNLPSDTPEPDRTWQALAAYNLGPGHFNAARTIALQKKADTASWFEMKKILPLLARPEYYERLKSGRARGGEAVILVENVRLFYDILQRYSPPYDPLEHLREEGSAELKAKPKNTGGKVLRIGKIERKPRRKT